MNFAPITNQLIKSTFLSTDYFWDIDVVKLELEIYMELCYLSRNLIFLKVKIVLKNATIHLFIYMNRWAVSCVLLLHCLQYNVYIHVYGAVAYNSYIWNESWCSIRQKQNSSCVYEQLQVLRIQMGV